MVYYIDLKRPQPGDDACMEPKPSLDTEWPTFFEPLQFLEIAALDAV